MSNTRLTTLDLSPLFRQSVGINRLFDRITSQLDSSNQNSGYPPYNILKRNTNEYEVQVAVAGFREGEITVEVIDGHLVVSGEQSTDDTHVEQVEVIHQGISARRFSRSFVLGERMEVHCATVENGILSVKLIDVVPERELPKSIDISYIK
jgi:molecular chaperone IbpA